MAKRTLTITTPVGTFNRKTDTAYTFACVMEAPEGAAVYAERIHAAGWTKGGVHGRIFKDRGYCVSWHNTKAAADKALAKGNSCYVANLKPVGVFPVDGAA